MGSMAQPDRDPLAATRRLLIDGSNLLHALSRTSGAAPQAALIGRLRGAIPAAVAIELVFDGPAERGLRNERIASGLTVRYSGPRTGDAVILRLIDDVHLLDGADGTATMLVVTDDRDLRHGSRLRGARTAGSAWLLGRLDARRLSSPSVGNPRAARGGRTGPPVSAASQIDGDPVEMDRPGWKPGRGATTKRGNPRRAPKGGATDSKGWPD
jgi:YacP-like NYN domain